MQDNLSTMCNVDSCSCLHLYNCKNKGTGAQEGGQIYGDIAKSTAFHVI